MEEGLVLSLQFTAFDIDAEYEYVGYEIDTNEYSLTKGILQTLLYPLAEKDKQFAE